VVNVVEAMLIEALRASAADEDADDQPVKQMATGSHQAEGEGDQVKDASHDNFTPIAEKRIKKGLVRPQ
jgi:hypothetical protein